MSDEFSALAELAKEGASNAYAPYSNFQVGAAIQTSKGVRFSGCNVENASFGVTLCAERNAITTAVATGVKPGEIERVVIYIEHDQLFSPCGACRQVMSEFMKPDSAVSAINNKGERKDWTMAELLPDSFSMPE